MARTPAAALGDMMDGNGIVDLASPWPVAETAERVAQLLTQKGMKIFVRIDQAAEAAAAGLSMRPMVLLIFGNPKAGTPLMIEHPSLAIDLPLKALVWEAADGSVRVSYNSSEFLRERHGLEAPPFAAVAAILKAALE